MGTYRPRYIHNDPEITSPKFGTEKTWGGHLVEESKLRKDTDFKNKVKKCPRVDRTLVYMRAKVYQ